jgi:F0F1-type ATP synthase assembly protein I
LLGAILGLAVGFLLGRIGLVRQPWGLIVGGCAGVLVALLVLGIHQRIRPKSAAPDQGPSPRPRPGFSGGGQQP